MKVKNGTASSVSLRQDAEHPLRQRLKQRRGQQTELDADEPEEQAVRGKRERDRVAEQQENDERREHERRHVGDEERAHFATSSSRATTQLHRNIMLFHRDRGSAPGGMRFA